MTAQRMHSNRNAESRSRGGIRGVRGELNVAHPPFSLRRQPGQATAEGVRFENQWTWGTPALTRVGAGRQNAPDFSHPQNYHEHR
jgi:hypothetical protein